MPVGRRAFRFGSKDLSAAGNQEGPAMVTPERLMQFTFGFAPPLVIEAALRHGVFELLDAGTKTVDQVCAETRTSERGDARVAERTRRLGASRQGLPRRLRPDGRERHVFGARETELYAALCL